MSINLSNQNAYQNNSFNANVNLQKLEEHQPVGVEMAKAMNLPTTPDEFRTFVPYSAAAVGLSALISKWFTAITRLNPIKNPKITLEESYNKSLIARASQKIDSKLLPIIEKCSPITNTIKNIGKKFTPNFAKNICEKIKIGVSPKSSLAMYTYNGPTKESAKYFFECLSKVDKDIVKKLGIDDLILKSAKMPKEALIEVAKRLSKMPAKNLTNLKMASPGFFMKKVNLVDELNKARAFIANNAKTPVSKGLQKLTMSSAEAAGGGVIGGNFGLLMNALFIASGIKRTWEAPKGEKFKTAMDALLVDFCGLYLMNLLGTGITYRLLGLKNLDKSAAEIKRITRLTNGINFSKEKFKIATNLKNHLLQNGITDKAKEMMSKLKLDASKFNSVEEALSAVTKKIPSVSKINLNIDKLAALKKYKSQGFFKDLLYKPLVAIGNFFSVGLETLPSKLADSKTGVSLFSSLKGKLKYGLKYLAGYPVRLILVAAIITPPLTKLFARITYGIFGKPSNPSVDIDGDKKKEEELKQVQAQIQNQTPLINMNDFANYSKSLANSANPTNPANYSANKNQQSQGGFYNPLIEQAVLAQKKKQAEALAVKPLRQNEEQTKAVKNKNSNVTASSPISSSAIASAPIPAASFKDKYKYIPSVKPTIFAPKFNPEVAAAIKESEGIEKAYNRAISDIKKGNY